MTRNHWPLMGQQSACCCGSWRLFFSQSGDKDADHQASLLSMVDAMQTVLTRHWHQTCGSVQEVSATCLMLGLELQFWHSPWQPDRSTKLQKQQCVKLCSAVSSYVVLHSCPQCTIIIEQIRVQLGHKTRISRRQIFEQCVLWETNKFKSSITRSWRCT